MNNVIEALLASPTKPFRSFSDKTLASECKRYELAITGNPAFPDPEPSMLYLVRL